MTHVLSGGRAAADVVRVALDPRRGTEVVIVPVGSEREAADAAHLIAPRLQALGFVPLHAGRALSSTLRNQLAHRHLALLALNRVEDKAALEWLRQLTATSPRAHLVVSFRVCSDAHEVSPAEGPETSTSERTPVSPRERSGDCCVPALRQAQGVPSASRDASERVGEAAEAKPAGQFAVCSDAHEMSRAEGLEMSTSERAPASPRERSGDRGAPASERVGGAAGAKPPGQFDRAERFDRRGRHAQAERWYRAALESSRRRRDESGQAAACQRLVEILCRRDAWDAGGRLAKSVFNSLRDATARAEVAALLADVLIAQAELGQANALLSAVSSELTLEGQPETASVNDARAHLRFWQGRLDEAAAIPRVRVSVSRLVVDGAIAFLRRDVNALTRCAEEAASLRSPPADYCARLFSMLGASVARDGRDVQTLLAHLGQRASAPHCPRLIRFGRALAVEACSVAGLSPPPPDARGSRRAPAHLPTLDRLFLEWQHAASVGDRDLERQAASRLNHVGARVVETWRWGSPDMHLVHAIPVLLQVVQDAEDDLTALVAIGAWIRREGGAHAVAFFDPERAIVAGDGWSAVDTAELRPDDADEVGRVVQAADGGVIVVRGVRYAGTVTGLVAVRGAGDRRDVLVETTNTAAALCGPALRARIDLVRAMRASPALSTEILGRSPSIVALREAVARAAVTPFPVLVEGESGTGKELVARAIHRLSPRRDRRFVAVNCAALTDELVEAELFGHTRGAFTGAIGSRTGLVEDAHGGSLFLDEVSELSARAQAKLLRVLQEREVRRVGENASRAVDVRVVAATNRLLADTVRLGTFREDLLFRLAVVRLQVPPLRDRIEDIPLLAHAVWRSLTTETGKRAVLGPDAIAQLCRHSWPGNVRELQNAMAGLLVIAPERGRISARHVGHVLSASSNASQFPALPLHRARANLERTAVAGALARHGGRRTLAARELGLTRQGLTKAMKRLGVA